jgi:hypothetical protein
MMDDSRPTKTARVDGPASYAAALKAWGGATTPNRRKGRYYVIVVHGRFVCGWCPRPAAANGRAAPSPRGSITTRLWSPTTGSNGIGLRTRLPASIARLSRPILISLR